MTRKLIANVTDPRFKFVDSKVFSGAAGRNDLPE